MTSHHAKFQLDSSKRSQVIPLQKSINDNDNDNDDDTHPGWIIVRVGMYSVADKNNNDNAYNKVARLGKDGDSTEALQDSFELGS